MKKTIFAILVVLLLVGILAFSAYGEETFEPYTDSDGVRQYCVCGNAFVVDANGTVAYVNGEDGCKNHKDESGNIVAGCDGTLLTWKPWNHTDYLPKNTGESGNWYLTAPVQMTAQNSIQANVKVVLDLNGFEAKGKENTRVYSIHKSGASLVLTDTSAAQTGKLTSHGTKNDHSLTVWVYLGSMEMYGGTIDASGMTSTASFAPCLRVTSGMTFDMFGGKIIGGTAGTNGGSIFVSSGGTANLYGGEVIGGNAASGGTIYSGGTLSIYGGKIHGGKATDGGNIYSSSATLSIYGGKIYDGTVTNNGGNIWGSGTVTIAGGEIYNGKSTGNPVYDSANSKYKTNNAAVGGNVYIGGGGDLTMTGGYIYDGAINGNRGGNIYIYGNSSTNTATVSFTGGYIWGGQVNADDSATGTEALNASGDLQGGSIYFYLAGEYSIGGNAVIGMKPDGTAAGGQAYRGGNLGLSGSAVLNMTGGTVHGGEAYEGGNIYSFGEMDISGGKITGGTATNNGGNICMGYGTLNISGTSQISGGNAKTGGAIGTASSSSGDRIVNITGGTIAENSSTGNGGAIYVLGQSATETNISISGGTFRKNTAGGNGGAISVGTRYSTVNITGGSFEENTATANGGHIFFNHLGTHSISDGTFTGGSAAKGGSIYLDTGVDNTVSINGGTFSGGSATEGGGNLYIAGTATISGGTISAGTSDSYGGNVYADGSMTLSGGTISGGSAIDGGNVALRGGTHTITGGTVTGGISQSAGGNLFFGSSAKITIENVTITSGTAGGMGGGLYMGSGTVTVNDCLIQGNKGNNGGNVAVYAGTLNFNGGKLKEGSANSWGGNLWTDHGTLNIAGGEITGGSASSYGGGIALASSKNGKRTLNITGGTISGNSAKGGGGLYIHGYSGYTSTVTISGGTICDNEATDENGGGLHTATSFCDVTITGNAVIKDNTAKKEGGNLSFANKGTRQISGGTITGGTAASGSCINVKAGALTVSGAPTIEAIRVDNAADASLEASGAAWTTAVAVEVTEQGVFATADSDKTAYFTPAEKLYVITYDADAQELSIGWPVLDLVYVSDNGDDYGAGTKADPYKTLDRALNVVSQNGTVHIVDQLAVTGWEAHDKSLTITGGEMNVTKGNPFYIRDSVHFKNMTMRFSTVTADTNDTAGKHRIYALGNKVIIDEDVTVQYGADGSGVTGQYVYLFGGGNSSNVVSSTDLTVLSGTWGRIFGGSNGSDISGDVHLTVGGKVNEGVDYVSHDYAAYYLIMGGSSAGNIGGTIYMNVTGGTHTSTHGASIGSSSATYTIGNIEMRVTGGEGMAIYCGGRTGTNQVTGEANLYYEGGEYEQVFGAGLTSLEGTLNLYVTGGEITRRLYGGAYNDSELNNQVHGIVNLYIGSGANLSLSYDSDRCIFAHSRYDTTVTEVERTRIIFLDQTAYNTHMSRLGAIDWGSKWVMGSSTSAADYICYLGTSASGNVITVGATEVEDNVSNALDLASATATVNVEQESYQYEGAPVEPATVTYSDSWIYGDAALTYANNNAAGTATATITANGVSASKDFQIVDNSVTVVVNGESKTYYSLQDAFDAAGAEGLVQLTSDVAQNVTVNTNLYLDLNGKNITGTVTVAEGVTLYGMDSTTNDYDCSDGYGKISTIVGSYAAHYKTEADSSVGKILRYLAVVEADGVSFHRFYLGIQKVTLKTSVTGFGYKAIFGGDEKVKEMLNENEAYGFNLWLDGSDAGAVRYREKAKFATGTDGTKVTLRLENFDIENYGSVAVKAKVYIKLADGTVIDSFEYSYSMQDMLKQINDNIDTYQPAQILAVQNMLSNYTTTVSSWGIDELLSWTEEETV